MLASTITATTTRGCLDDKTAPGEFVRGRRGAEITVALPGALFQFLQEEGRGCSVQYVSQGRAPTVDLSGPDLDDVLALALSVTHRVAALGSPIRVRWRDRTADGEDGHRGDFVDVDIAVAAYSGIDPAVRGAFPLAANDNPDPCMRDLVRLRQLLRRLGGDAFVRVGVASGLLLRLRLPAVGEPQG